MIKYYRYSYKVEEEEIVIVYRCHSEKLYWYSDFRGEWERSCKFKTISSFLKNAIGYVEMNEQEVFDFESMLMIRELGR
jgi:hypothetical protein